MLVGLWKRETGEQLVFRLLWLQINFQWMLPELELHNIGEAVICYFYPASPLSALLICFLFWMDPSPFSYAYEGPLRCAKYIKWNTNYGTEVVDTKHSSFNSNEVWARYGSMQVVKAERPKVLQSWQSKFLVCLVTENLEFKSDFIGVNSLLNYVYQLALRRRELVAGMRSGAGGRSRGRGDKKFKLPFHS